MTLRIKPLLYIFVVLLVVFSIIGYFVFNYIIPANQQKVFENLKSSTVTVNNDLQNEQEKIYFTVNEQSTLVEAVKELKMILADSDYTNYELSVQSPDESAELLDAWNYLQYYVYEIMGQRTYTDIPKLAAEFNELNPQISLMTSMDEQYLYLTLTSGDCNLYRMLPLNPPEVRMWG